MTNGYSGADIELLCREAAMKPVRRLMDQLSQIDSSAYLPPQPPDIRSSKTSLQNGGRSKSVGEIVDISSMLQADPVTMDDIMSALDTTKKTSVDGQSTK